MEPITLHMSFPASMESHIIALPYLVGFGFFFLTTVMGGVLWAIFTKLEVLCAHLNDIWILGYKFTGIWEENKIANTLYFLKGEFISRKDSEGVMLIEAAEKLLTKKRRKRNAISSDSTSVEG